MHPDFIRVTLKNKDTLWKAINYCYNNFIDFYNKLVLSSIYSNLKNENINYFNNYFSSGHCFPYQSNLLLDFINNINDKNVNFTSIFKANNKEVKNEFIKYFKVNENLYSQDKDKFYDNLENLFCGDLLKIENANNSFSQNKIDLISEKKIVFNIKFEDKDESSSLDGEIDKGTKKFKNNNFKNKFNEQVEKIINKYNENIYKEIESLSDKNEINKIDDFNNFNDNEKEKLKSCIINLLKKYPSKSSKFILNQLNIEHDYSNKLLINTSFLNFFNDFVKINRQNN